MADTLPTFKSRLAKRLAADCKAGISHRPAVGDQMLGFVAVYGRARELDGLGNTAARDRLLAWTTANFG